ncbi:MAG: AAC(3) family N-acetyltransferase [Proteiniphilum sp.]|uniref:AAC(3) family N-acetyltransferase n=1 Tax=Proteiniphilum sp. TaxID=1926877 RepID=UPI002B1F71C6|nr:AAC(3) family N-acetyltransferase [Proteiniphilum sp.]MEA5129356.1 AAC(3) family N-acetyltransferase [Proteiniphilum sp.]
MPIKLFVKKIIPASYRLKIKKIRRHTKNFFKRNAAKITLGDMRKLLTQDFGINKGDNLIVSSSFGNLNAAFSPTELIKLLQDIIGNEGNLVMPFYPPGNSHEWAASGQVFDMQGTCSSMGILTQVFSEMPDVHKSMHPTKAVVAWGKDAEEIVLGHENSKTPFYWDSPYGWLLKKSSKSLGLGLKNIPIFHSFEDIILENKYTLYQDKQIILILKTNKNEEKQIVTLVHDPLKLIKLIDAGDYVKSLRLNTYRRVNFGFTFCYIVDNQELFDKCKIEFNNNNFRFKK